LTSSTRTVSSVVSTNRRPSLKLVLVFVAAMVLVTLPVIPMRLYGVGFEPLKQLTSLFHFSSKSKSGDLSTQLDDTDSRQSQTSALKQQGELTSLDSAAQKLAAGIAANPDDPSLHNQLGLIYEGLGDTEKAVNQFQASVSLARTGLLALSTTQKTLREQMANDKLSASMIQTAKLSTDLSAAHSALARLYDQMGMRDKVVAELDLLNRDRAFSSAAAQRSTEEPAGNQNSVHRLSTTTLQLVARAQALSQAHRSNEAIQIYKEVISLDPKAAIAHQQLGLAAIAAGNSYLAKEELLKASELDPTNASNYIALGLAYKGMSQFEMSRNAMQKAVQLDPKNFNALFQLGSMYSASGKNDLAAQMFERVVELSPNSAAAHNNLGSSLSMSGHPREAIPEFEKALALSPELASSHYGMGIALYNVKEYPAAISELKRALALNPGGYSDAKQKIALAYRRTNSGTMGGAGFN
jgi:tetratricopeptide (TPR) repeat protein